MTAPRVDLLIIGGGLAGGLAALAVRAARPELTILVIEPGPKIGGNHLWSFFGDDLDAAGHALVAPLVARSWPGYSVRFPGHQRRLAEPYHTIASERLDDAVRGAGIEVCEESATEVRPNGATLAGGARIAAGTVLDARGLIGTPTGLRCGWQKFVGQMFEIPLGHGLEEPIVMDACVDQSDGYRFVYCLPFSPTQLFVEDTYYQDNPALDAPSLEDRIADYVTERGWRAQPGGRSERGILPVVTGGAFDRFWPASDQVARAGTRAGLFHPLTSYSLPDAARFAGWLANQAPLDGRLAAASREVARKHWSRGWFDRMLGRMLFQAAAPAERFRVLERFYHMPAPLIARFYAGRSTLLDRFRVVAGRPPVAVTRGLRAALS